VLFDDRLYRSHILRDVAMLTVEIPGPGHELETIAAVTNPLRNIRIGLGDAGQQTAQQSCLMHLGPGLWQQAGYVENQWCLGDFHRD